MHPTSIYGFTIMLVALLGIIVLMALGDVQSDVGVPLIAGAIGLGGGAAAGIAAPSTTNTAP